MTRLPYIAVTFSILLAPLAAVAEVIDVPNDVATIQEAIDAARDGDKIRVHPGVHMGPIDFNGKNVHLRSVAGPEATTIVAPGETVLSIRSGEGPGAIVDGFSIGSVPAAPAEEGAGWAQIIVERADPVFVDCLFETVGTSNDALIELRSSSALIESCTFRNTGGELARGVVWILDGNGAAASHATVRDCDFIGPKSGVWVEDAAATISNCLFHQCRLTLDAAGDGTLVERCTFRERVQDYDGGGMEIFGGAPVITGCLFLRNKLVDIPDGGAAPEGSDDDKRGGGIFVVLSTAVIEDCLFMGNVARYGGGLFAYRGAPTIRNCTFLGNSARGTGPRGGGLAGYQCDGLITGCTFRANHSEHFGGGMWLTGASVTLADSEFCANLPDQLTGAYGNGGGISFTSDCLRIPSNRAESFFGDAVVSIGDIDGDQIPEVLVGAPRDGLAGDRAGRIHVYSGFDFSPLHEQGGQHAGDRFGTAAAAAGDVDDDGVPDFIVGAPYHDGAGANAGRITVYSGADWSKIRSHIGAAPGDRFGASIAGDRDLNGDGVADYVIGAPWNDDAGANAGRITAFDGTNGSVLFVARGAQAGDRFGRAVALLGMDETSEAAAITYVAVGAPRNDHTAKNAGAVHLLDAESGDTVFTWHGKKQGDRFGGAVARAGRILDDPSEAVIVGAPRSGQDDRGRVEVYLPLVATKLWAQNGRDPGSRLGAAVSGGDDFTGDGLDDVVVGAPGFDNGRGRARVLRGADGAKLWSVLSDVDDARLGCSVAILGDITMDGLPDVATGGPHDGETGSRAGVVRLRYSNPDDTSAVAERTGAGQGNLGARVADLIDELGPSDRSRNDLDRDGNITVRDLLLLLAG